jgi:hypothetical protein
MQYNYQHRQQQTIEEPEADALDSSLDANQQSLPKFPEWQRIRQQYFRMRKVGERLKNDTMKQREQLMKNATYVIKEDNDLEIEVSWSLSGFCWSGRL